MLSQDELDEELRCWQRDMMVAAAVVAATAFEAMQVEFPMRTPEDRVIVALNAISNDPQVRRALARGDRWSVANDRTRFQRMVAEQEQDLTIPPRSLVDRVAHWLRA